MGRDDVTMRDDTWTPARDELASPSVTGGSRFIPERGRTIVTIVTSSQPSQWLREVLALAGSQHVRGKFQCPVHGLDGAHTPSLAVGDRRDGAGAWVHCHAGCEPREVLHALRLTRPDLATLPARTPAEHVRAWRLALPFPPPKLAASGSLGERGFRFEREHPYAVWADPTTPVAWKERYRHVSGLKEIRWESRNPRGERVPGLLGRSQSDLLLYRYADWRVGAAAGEAIHLVESESSVDALMRAGLYATCWAGGAGDPPEAQLRYLLGPLDDQVVVVPDRDAAGVECARRLHAWLPAARLLLGAPGEDARDLLGRLGPGGFGEPRSWWSRVDWPE